MSILIGLDRGQPPLPNGVHYKIGAVTGTRYFQVGGYRLSVLVER